MKLIAKSFSVLFIIFCFSGSRLHAQNSHLLAAVKIDGKWAYINDSGKQVIPPLFHTAYSFKDGVAAVKFGPFWGYAAPEGHWALKPVFTECRSFNNKRAQINIFEPRDSIMITGFISPSGEFIYEIEPYELAWDYHDNRVRVRSANNFGPAFGFRDTMGKWVVQPRFDASSDFSEGLAAVRIGTKWSFIDDTGHMVLPMVYDEANSFSEEIAQVKKDGKVGFINKKGKWLFTSKYDETAIAMKDGMIAVRKNGKVGFIDAKGKLVVKPEYDTDFLNQFSEGMAAVAKKDADGNLKWGYIDKKGKLIIPTQYEWAEPFSNGFAAVKINGKWGYINTAGKMVIDAKYDEAFEFSITY